MKWKITSSAISFWSSLTMLTRLRGIPMEPEEKGKDNIMKASRDEETDGDRLIEE